MTSGCDGVNGGMGPPREGERERGDERKDVHNVLSNDDIFMFLHACLKDLISDLFIF